MTQGAVWRALDRLARGLLAALANRRNGYLALTALLCGGAAAGCGSTGSADTTHRHTSVADHVCARAQQAAHRLLTGAAHLRIVSADPNNIECVIDGGGAHVDVVAQASAVAWTEYDTAAVHQAQAYGTGAVHQQAQQPHTVPGMGGNATWIPAKQELIATNGTQSRGGSYLTVTVRRHSRHAPSGVVLAAAVGRVVLATAPRGPNPGPPPS